MGKFQKYLLTGLILWSSAVIPPESPAQPVSLPGMPAVGDALGLAVSDENLSGQTGRQDTVIDQMDVRMSDVKNDARMESSILSVTGSTLNNGANTIAQNAFSNAGGLVTVIQNSGNQVLIQNDMVLNLFMK